MHGRLSECRYRIRMVSLSDGDRIVAGLGVIENDFHDRKDLKPNVCAVWTDEEYRNMGIAGRLLNLVVEDFRTDNRQKSILMRPLRD